MSKAPGWPRPGGVSCAGRTPSPRARLRATRERAGPGQFRPAPRFPGAGGRAVASSLAPWSSGQRRPERAGPLLPAALAGGPGSHRPPRHPALHGGGHALAAAAPAPRAQDPEPARGELQAGQCQPHAGRPARRSPRVLARRPHLHRRLPGRGQVKAVRGESEPRGRDLSAGELRGLFEACARAPREAAHQSGRGRASAAGRGLPGHRLRLRGAPRRGDRAGPG
jgi:hypothetical protein